jgi:hypothetical protein
MSQESANAPWVKRDRPLTKWTHNSGERAGKAANSAAKATAKTKDHICFGKPAETFFAPGCGWMGPLMQCALEWEGSREKSQRSNEGPPKSRNDPSGARRIWGLQWIVLAPRIRADGRFARLNRKARARHWPVSNGNPDEFFERCFEKQFVQLTGSRVATPSKSKTSYKPSFVFRKENLSQGTPFNPEPPNSTATHYYRLIFNSFSLTFHEVFAN